MTLPESERLDSLETRLEGLGTWVEKRLKSTDRRYEKLRSTVTSGKNGAAGLSQVLDELAHRDERIEGRLALVAEQLAELHEALEESRTKFEGGIETARVEDRIARLGIALEDSLDVLREQLPKVEPGAQSAPETMATSLGEIGERLGSLEARLEDHLTMLERRALRQRGRTMPDYEAFFELAHPVVSAGRTLLDYDRLYVLWQAARNAARLKLPAVEIGTYQGGSAYFLASALRVHLDAEPELHVFDTFAGHLADRISEVDAEQHGEGAFGDASRRDVEEYLAPFPGIHVHEGDVAKTAASIKEERLSLVHVDVDLYLPTHDSLRAFGSRLARGGVLVVDDYGAAKCPGVRKAVEEYLARNTDFQLWHSDTEQVLLVKVPVSGPRSRSTSGSDSGEAGAGGS